MADDPNNPQTSDERDGGSAVEPERGGGAPSGSSPSDSAAGDLAEEALRAAEEAIQSLGDMRGDEAPAAGGAQPFAMPSFDEDRPEAAPAAIDILSDVNLNVKIELGRTRMLVEDVLKLAEGAVVELDKLAGDPVDVYVNERHVARGEVLVLNDNFCVRINEIISPNARRATSA
mgnify:CR=1 FL=1